MAAGLTTWTTNVSRATSAAAAPVLEKESITKSEYLRLCIAYLAEHGEPPFPIPEAARAVSIANRATWF
jgi:antitoxin component of RelBE/YafQ-DinJ toxin-antitoxin module